jgi:hypothetical protein
MYFMNLIMLSDFRQVLDSKRNHYTKKDSFSGHIQFTIIYLLQKKIITIIMSTN